MTDETNEFQDPTPEPDEEVTAPETVDEEPALDPDVETSGVLSATVPENYLSEEERKVQEQHEALAAELAPGDTLPWVAPTPSAVQPPEIAAPDPEDALEDKPDEEPQPA